MWHLSIDTKRIVRQEIVGDREEVATFILHIAKVVLKVQLLLGNVHGYETIRSSLGVRAEKLGVGTERNAVVAVAGLRVAGRARKDDVCVVTNVVTEAVVMSTQHDTLMLLNYLNQRPEFGVVASGGQPGVVQSQDLPVCFRLLKDSLDKFNLFLLLRMAFSEV